MHIITLINEYPTRRLETMKNRIELIIGLLEEAMAGFPATSKRDVLGLLEKAHDYSLELQKGIDDLQE